MTTFDNDPASFRFSEDLTPPESPFTGAFRSATNKYDPSTTPEGIRSPATNEHNSSTAPEGTRSPTTTSQRNFGLKCKRVLNMEQDDCNGRTSPIIFDTSPHDKPSPISTPSPFSTSKPSFNMDTPGFSGFGRSNRNSQANSFTSGCEIRTENSGKRMVFRKITRKKLFESPNVPETENVFGFLKRYKGNMESSSPEPSSKRRTGLFGQVEEIDDEYRRNGQVEGMDSEYRLTATKPADKNLELFASIYTTSQGDDACWVMRIRTSNNVYIHSQFYAYCTANEAGLRAVMFLLKNYSLNRIHIQSNNMYLCKGIKSWCSKWAANKWMKADGTRIKYQSFWEKIYKHTLHNPIKLMLMPEDINLNLFDISNTIMFVNRNSSSVLSF